MPEDPPSASSGQESEVAASVGDLRLTDTQRQILTALCRPCMGGNRYATPATNQAIAAEVYLSVDAVKAHLRALYRKFGVEPLPHNQKRARLVELVLEGGLLPAEQEGADRDLGVARPAALPPPPARAGRPGGRRLLFGGLIAVAAVGLAVILIVLLSGDSSSESSPQALSEPEYVAAVKGYCHRAFDQLALVGQQRLARATTARRAGAYLAVIETVRGGIESLSAPPVHNRALVRFRTGLERAAHFTRIVSDQPPEPGTRANANIVAELTFAAGQVQAGALGYRLGPACSKVGDVVAHSASNAAGTP